MDKKIITNATLQALLESDLVFNKATFEKRINHFLLEHDLELHEKTLQKILKNLQTKDYIDIEEDHIFKTSKTILKKNNKQRDLFEILLREFGDSFDTDYIKYQYIKSIKNAEEIPTEHFDFIEQSFKFLSKEFGIEHKSFIF